MNKQDEVREVYSKIFHRFNDWDDEELQGDYLEFYQFTREVMSEDFSERAVAYYAGEKSSTARHEEEIERLEKEKLTYIGMASKLNSLLDDVGKAYEDLLNDAKDLYQYYPNAFRKTTDKYFAEEIEILKKIIKETRG